MTVVRFFREQYRFLSNFFDWLNVLDDMDFRNVEHVYQASCGFYNIVGENNLDKFLMKIRLT